MAELLVSYLCTNLSSVLCFASNKVLQIWEMSGLHLFSFDVLSNRNTSPVFCTVFVVFFECLHMAPVSNVLQEVLMTNSCSTCMRTLPIWDQQPLDLCQDDPLVVLALQRVNRNLAHFCHICESFFKVTSVGRQHPRVVISAQAQRFPLPLHLARRGPASSGGSWTA